MAHVLLIKMPPKTQLSAREMARIRAGAAVEMQGRKEKIEGIANWPGLMEFIPEVTPRWVAPYHLKPVVDLLERVLHEGNQRIILSVPPRHAKSETLLHFMPWYIRQRPHDTVGYISYAASFTESKITKSHDIALKVGVQPHPKIQNKTEWRTLEGGGFLTAGIGGPLTGYGLNVGIIDDPIKNREEAESKTIRDKQWGWFEDVFETRLEPGASAIILMTRWHEDDLSGRAIKNRGYEVIRIPALADGLDAYGRAVYETDAAGNVIYGPDEQPIQLNMDPNGRQIGEALWPMRYQVPWFEEIKKSKPVSFLSMYQGLPRDKRDKLFQDATFFSPEQKFERGFKLGAGIDLAYSEKTHANFSVFLGGAKKDSVIQIWSYDKWRDSINVTLPRLRLWQKKYPVPFRVEANGPQKAVADVLKRGHVRIFPVTPVHDKYARALDVAEHWNAGGIQLPQGEEWVSDFLDVVINFTGLNDLEDDDVDALENLFRSLMSGRFNSQNQEKPPEASHSWFGRNMRNERRGKE